jgi:hypothetical protein
MKPLPPKVRWTGSPIEVAIALGLLGPAWLDTEDCDEKKLSRDRRVDNYHPTVKLSSSKAGQ